MHPTFSQATVFAWYIGSVHGSGVPVHVVPVQVHPGEPSWQLSDALGVPLEVNAASHDAAPAHEYRSSQLLAGLQLVTGRSSQFTGTDLQDGPAGAGLELEQAKTESDALMATNMNANAFIVRFIQVSRHAR